MTHGERQTYEGALLRLETQEEQHATDDAAEHTSNFGPCEDVEKAADESGQEMARFCNLITAGLNG